MCDATGYQNLAFQALKCREIREARPYALYGHTLPKFQIFRFNTSPILPAAIKRMTLKRFASLFAFDETYGAIRNA